MERGLYGIPEILDEIWYYYNNERERNKELWKEVKRLRKKLGLATNPLLKQEER
jgi:FMN phosphatase YigB (HAD superfamily)